MQYSCITNLAIWVYNDKAFFEYICNPNTSISSIIELIRPEDEWAEIAFSGRQNAENEHCETLKELEHKLKFRHYTCLYKTLNVLFVYYYSSKLSLQWENVVFADISFPNSSICKIIDLKRPVDEWAKFAFSARRNAENDHCKTLRKLVH